MTVTISLSPSEEATLREKATEHGAPVDERAHALLSQQFRTPPYDPIGALAVLDSFMEQDEAEHRDTLAILRLALDEDRPGQRRLFGSGMNPQAPKTL